MTKSQRSLAVLVVWLLSVGAAPGNPPPASMNDGQIVPGRPPSYSTWEERHQEWENRESAFVYAARQYIETASIPELQSYCSTLQIRLNMQVTYPGPYGGQETNARRQHLLSLMQYCQATVNQAVRIQEGNR